MLIALESIYCVFFRNRWYDVFFTLFITDAPALNHRGIRVVCSGCKRERELVTAAVAAAVATLVGGLNEIE